MGTVETVLGPVTSDDLAAVMHHEHLLSLTPGPWLAGGLREPTDWAEHQVSVAVDALSRVRELGFDTVVDLSPYGVVGRDPGGENVALLREISRRSGLHIVAGTAVYLEAYSPEWTRHADIDALTERFVADATTGIGDTDIRAGIFGEQATGLNEITPHEEKCLRAAARAQRQTGLALTTHTTHGTMALEQIDILRDEGVDLTRIVIGHMDTRPELDYVRAVLDTGVNIAFDTVGKQNWDFFLAPPPSRRPDGAFTRDAYHRSDLTRAEWLLDLVRAGFTDRILLAQDLTGAEVYLNADTHGRWGYSYLGSPFTQLLLDGGATRDQIDRMTRANPLRLLSR
jgi:phosphotriesterase-related protein